MALKKIEDYSAVKLGSITGALGHHLFLTSDKKAVDEIRSAVRYIDERGVRAFVNKEYPNPQSKEKNIILNNISGRLFVTDGNKHCVSLVIANKDISIGDLFDVSPYLFRYWEEGYELGGDTAYQPYVTYIPYGINASRVPAARQGVDDKGARIHIIQSDIQYDSEIFDEADRGRPIYHTAHAFEVEEVYRSQGAFVEKADSISEILGYCGKMYEQISKRNVKYGFVAENSGYDHTLIWYIAGRVLSMKVSEKKLAERLGKLREKEFAEMIFDSIDTWVRGEK